MALFVRRRWPQVLAAVGVLAVLVAGGWWLLRDDAPEPTGDVAVVETADPVPEPTLPSVSLGVLATSPDLGRYAGHAVSATDTRVQSVVGPSAVWVEPPGGGRVLVVVVGTERTFDGVTAGTALTFTGEVRLSTRDFGRALGLTGDDADQFAEQGGYVEIETFTTG